MKKLNYILFALVCLVLPGRSNAQFKVLGYIWSKTNMVQDLKNIDLEKITHLNIAFVNPGPDGSFKALPAIDTAVKIAHLKNIKVLMSCGGGGSHAYYAELLKGNKRKKLVEGFIAILDQYNLDGIDVDLEGDDIDENYQDFVVELRRALSKRNKLLTAAVAWWTRDRITDKALRQFDFINIMAYDQTGPWKPETPGQHAPLNYAIGHLKYWKEERGMPKEKLNLGLPFYGYGFGDLPRRDAAFRSMGWKDIVKKFPDSLQLDEINLPENAGTIYYNGKATVRTKTELALKEAGGVMIWQLMYDTQDEHSLLKLINETVKE